MKPFADTPSDDANSIFNEAMSLFDKLFAAQELEPVVYDFLEAWWDGDYEKAFDFLSSNSPLLDGLPRDEWVALRQRWHNEAQPEEGRAPHVLELGEDIEDDGLDDETDDDLDGVADEDEQEEESDEDESFIVEAYWSLECKETPLSSQLKELPKATAIFPDTGRHWFWVNFTLVDEDDEWHIHDMSDEGAKALALSPDEIRERLHKIEQHLKKRGEELEENEELALAEEDEEDDMEDEEDEYDELSLAQSLGLIEEVVSISARTMHYCDVLITQEPQKDATIYDDAYNQAKSIQDHERAIVYLQGKADNFPAESADALRALGVVSMSLADTYEEEDNALRKEHFLALAEKVVRGAIATDNAPLGYLELAEVFMKQHKPVEEAEALLHQAEALSPSLQETALIEASLAIIAKRRGDTEGALQHYQRVSQATPDFPTIWLNIGQLQHELGQHDKAEESLRYSIEVEPEEVDAYVGLANIYMTIQHDFKKAKNVLEQGLEVDGQSPDLLVAFTLLYGGQKDLHTAQDYLEEAEEIAPDLDIVREMRAKFNLAKAEHQRQAKAKGEQRKGGNKGKPRKKR